MLVIWHKNRRAYYRKHHGALGGLWIDVCVQLRVWEEWLKIGHRNRRDPARKAAERAHLAAARKELRAS
jgi:hypothetical protein